MKLKGLNNREYNINLSKYIVRKNDTRKKSKYHLAARELLENKFKGYTLLEELKLPGTVNPSKKSALFLDFFIPNLLLGIEVHGQQHYEYCPFFHKSRGGYILSQQRDVTKSKWCELNEIDLVVFKYSEQDRWEDQLEY